MLPNTMAVEAKKEDPQHLVLVGLFGGEQPQNGDQPANQRRYREPQGAVCTDLLAVGVVLGLQCAALGAADGGFVNLVAAASAIRH